MFSTDCQEHPDSDLIDGLCIDCADKYGLAVVLRKGWRKSGLSWHRE